MAKITSINARQILNCKGDPAIEAIVTLGSGLQAVASCPSGTSSGTHEALELLDQDASKYDGKGVLKAINNIETVIHQALIGRDIGEQKLIDQTLFDLDGTANKSKLGANAILSVSMACMRAAALSLGVPLYKHVASIANNTNPLEMPTPLCNLINGGLHAGKNLDIQEFLVIPIKSATFANAMEKVILMNNFLRKALIQRGFAPLVGYEGGFSPTLSNNQEALDLLCEIMQQAGIKRGEDMMLGMDAAATSFFKNGLYTIKDRPLSITATDLAVFYEELIKKYQLLYLEDIFAEDDLAGWSAFTPKAPQGTIVTGDDLTVTNPQRLSMALERHMIRGIIIKPNQIGTITETLAVVKQAKAADLTIIASHRSGETNDDFIADFAVGIGADFAKFGAPVRGERVAKYNRLMQIEQELNAKR
jgi:enolase